MFYIDVQYVNFLSPRFRNFKQQKNDLYNLSCPYCGDSEKDTRKARGYFYRKGNALFYRCHNCGFGTTLRNFLKDHANDLFCEYIREQFVTNSKPTIVTETTVPGEKPVFVKRTEFETLSNLPERHKVIQFVMKRKIPEKHWEYLGYTDNFRDWVGKNTDRYSGLRRDARLILPFFDPDGQKVVAAQGRVLDPKSPMRYITVKFIPDYPKVFGLERWNPSEFTPVVEGPIDSLFLNNSLAVAGGDVAGLPLSKERCSLVFDNEPRNYQTVKKMTKAIENGWKLFIWPSTIRVKDINDAYLEGIDMNDVIREHTYHGASLKLRFSNWKKNLL